MEFGFTLIGVPIPTQILVVVEILAMAAAVIKVRYNKPLKAGL
jgi:hypothetical protein